MQILIVNPNTTNSMTKKIEVAAKAIAHSSTHIMVTNPSDGPVSIEGYYDEAFSVPGLLQEIIKGEDPNVAAHIIACFDDTGLDALRCLTDKPVVGIGEAGYRMASMLCNKFSVVTTLARSVPALEHNLMRYGLDRQCQRVRSSEVPVLELEHAQPEALKKI